MRCQNLILGCEDVKLLYSRKYEHEDREIRDMAILEYNEKIKKGDGEDEEPWLDIM